MKKILLAAAVVGLLMCGTAGAEVVVYGGSLSGLTITGDGSGNITVKNSLGTTALYFEASSNMWIMVGALGTTLDPATNAYTAIPNATVDYGCADNPTGTTRRYVDPSGNTIYCNGTTKLYDNPARANDVSGAATKNLTVAETSRTILHNFSQVADASMNLPAAQEGLTFVGVVSTKVAVNWAFVANGAENLCTDTGGTLACDNTWIRANNQEIGSRISCVTFKATATTWKWLCGTSSGTWTTD